ncbi:MarR family transcriptional regulator [Rugosimonospora acidiphila]|uniref:MarR family transcriptional regulator n=1 Tax=Rugosimonospora acidiphila TaxID=556531 RepID=A0ABP9S8H9_9ACTN
MTRWLDDAQMRAWLGYRRMRLLLDLQVSRDLAESSGLSDADYDVLSNLSDTDGHRLRLTELSAHMRWSRSRLSHHLTRMQQRGLITREECPSDGRGAVILLTDAGWEAIRAAAGHHVESVRRHFIDRLTDEQIRVLGDIADAVVPHLDDVPSRPAADRR